LNCYSQNKPNIIISNKIKWIEKNVIMPLENLGNISKKENITVIIILYDTKDFPKETELLMQLINKEKS
jgi:hypothetical protein